MSKLSAVVAWRDAAISDGWESSQTYRGGEAEDSASTLTRERWRAQVYARSERDCSVYVWGPDGLAVPAGDVYDFPALLAGLTHCKTCGRSGVSTHRVGFAGRVCAACLPAERKRVVTPGWCN